MVEIDPSAQPGASRTVFTLCAHVVAMASYLLLIFLN